MSSLLLAALPAANAAWFSAASVAAATLSDARRRALCDVLPKGAASAMRRYTNMGPTIEARWMVARVAGIVTSALLFHDALVAFSRPSRLLLAALAAIWSFGIPSEIAKAFVTRSAERTAPTLIRLLWPFEILAAPLAAPAGWLGDLVRLTFPKRITLTDVTEEEVNLIVKDGERSGTIAHDEAEMIHNVLGFADLTARDLMVARTRVTSLPLDTTPSELLRIVLAEGHSRYPVYDERIDNVIGILHVKDILPFTIRPGGLDHLELERLLHRPVLFVTESQSSSSVLYEMRQKRQHLAIVIDEFGGVSGVLALEDLLERIVGDIRDEHDEAEPPIQELGDGRLLVDATVPIVDLSRYLDTELPDDGDYNSLGGLLITRLGRVPPVGAKMSEYGLEFVVRAADERHVSKVEIVRRSTPPDAVEPRSLRPTPED
ncbi:MAG TPA: hemolysin family protein [Polyangiaceae bacterium]|nr:hemolysin family protein [Polyangiaceae bacterium]